MLGRQQRAERRNLGEESEEFRVLAGEYSVSRLQLDSTFQILIRAGPISREPAAQGHCIKHMVGVGLKRQSVVEMLSGPFYISRVKPFHAVVEMILGRRYRRLRGCGPLFANALIRPRLIRDMRSRSFGCLLETRACFKQLALRKKLNALLVSFQLHFIRARRFDADRPVCRLGL